MSKKSLQTLFSLLLMVGMLFSLATPTTALAQSPASPTAAISVDPQVLDEMTANGSTSYWIDFSSKADLMPAYGMNWSDRGWYVYKQLSETAKASQANVSAYLSAQGVSYKSYWIKNTILVESSDMGVLNGLLSFAEIENIGPRKTYVLYTPDTSAAAITAPNAIEPNLTHINADDAWALGFDGTGYVVANIDTGVRYSHQALVGSYRGNDGGTFDHNYNWFNPDDLSDSTPRDGNGHGTHTMGTMVGNDGGANQIGIAPGAEWMACAGCPDGSCTDSALLGCGQFIAAPTDLTGANANPDMRPNAVNNSWGDCGQTYNNWYAAPITAWHAAGVYPVFSNGNASNCGYPPTPGLNTVGNPARSGNVTGVGSSGEQNGQYATHSNWGPTDNLDTVNPVAGFESMKPQVIAPGVSIRSSTPGSDTEYQDGWSGTSMSAPHVTGLIAMIWQAAPCLEGDYATTETLIEDTAMPIVYDDGSAATPTNDPNFATGWGEIDALAAVNQAVGMCAIGTLEGMVTDGTNPVEGVSVKADDGAGYTRTVLTAADGTYSMSIMEGTYTVTATKYGYETDLATSIVITEGATTSQDFLIAPLGMTLVSGTVADGGVEGLGLHGYPLYASIHITATGFDETVYTDPFTGYYEIELVEETEHTFTVNAVPSGYDTLVQAVTPMGTAYTQDFDLMVDGAVCAAPGYQPDYDIFYSFEAGDEGFTPGGTTSFAWGDFTSGPGEGHSGTKGIATNPGGDHNASELGWMASPAIDLTDFGTATPVIQWYDWKDIESASYDWARVDVTKDGGTTWTSVWGPVGGVTDTAYQQQTLVLDPSYNVPNFQFRFYFKSDSSVQNAGWYVDDIGIIAVPVPAPTNVFSTNFDADNGGFAATGANSSWAWGAPSAPPGPGAPYSAPNVWATNLTGNYNNSEESYITSPVIDLSAHVGKTPTISFWHWYDSESNTFDWGGVEVSKDGGTTWTSVWQKFGTSVSPWTLKSLALDATYAVSNFQFRFHFHSDSSVNSYAGWYIDDVAVSVAEPVEIAAPCVVIPGGVVAGFVSDWNTDEVLVGADVVSPIVATQTFELEDDPDNAGLYWVFHPLVDPNNYIYLPIIMKGGAAGFNALAGSQIQGFTASIEFTASMVDYAPSTETVLAESDAVTRQDFFLDAGWLSVVPTTLEHTMMMGDPAETATLTIENAGYADATFELAEKDEGFTLPVSIPAFTGSLPVDTRPVSMGRAPDAPLASLSAASLFNGLLGAAPAFAVDAYPGENLVYLADAGVPGTWSVVGAVAGTEYFAGDFVDGDFSTLYVINSTGSVLKAIDTTTAAATTIGTATPPAAGQSFAGLTGAPGGELYGVTTDCASSNLVMVDPATAATTNLGALSGVGCGIDLAYNTDDDMIYIVDIVTDSLYKVDPATMTTTLVGALGANANYAQGMDYEEESGILYWAAYTTSGELRTIDMTTGASALVGAFPGGAEVDSFGFTTGGASDVPWLSEDPVSGTVVAEGSTDVTVTFDPVTLSQPGDYMAELKVKHNTPYTVPNVPVTLHLVAPASFGTLNGTVSGLGQCDENPGSLEGATVNIYDQAAALVASATTTADGFYTWALVAGTYDIEVMADGHVAQTTQDVVLGASTTVTTDFDLRLSTACIVPLPTSLEKTQAPNTTGTVTLTIQNIGAAAGNFELAEYEAAQLNADVELILDDGSRDNGIGIGGASQFVFLNRFTPSADAYPFELTEIQVYFAAEDLVAVGHDMKLVVYENVTGNTDPSVGSNYLAGFPVTVQTLDAWNSYILPEPVMLEGPGDVLIGVIALELPGAAYYPAAIDETATQERSWAGWWTAATAPEVPTLPPDSDWTLIDAYFPGNWMVRGMGSSASADIIWLSEDPVSGTVAADSSLPVTVTFNATGMALGDYFARLRLSRAPEASTYIPVTLHVAE